MSVGAILIVTVEFRDADARHLAVIDLSAGDWWRIITDVDGGVAGARAGACVADRQIAGVSIDVALVVIRAAAFVGGEDAGV